MAVLRGTATFYIDESVTGDVLPVILEWNGTTPMGVSGAIDLPAATDVTLTAPVVTGANNTVLVLIPPTTNTVAWVIKGNAGDTGTSLRPAQPTALGYGGGVTILRAAALISGVRFIWL